MTEIHRVSPEFAVAGQLELSDLARAAAMGFKTVIKNRPEGEDPGQPSDAEMKQAAEAAGVTFKTLPFAGLPPSPAIVAETATLLENVEGPVLAYCRSGKRSIMAWAMAQALSGNHSPNEIIALAGKAGYDMEGARKALEGLAPRT